MQQTLQSKFLDILLSLSLPRNILHYESLLTANSFALLCSPLTLDITLSLMLFTC